MSEFVVESLYLGGLKNKVYRSGETVTQECFSERVEKLVELGFIKPILTESNLDDATEDNSIESAESAGIDIPDLTKAEIVLRLTAMKATFKKSWSEAALRDLLVELS